MERQVCTPEDLPGIFGCMTTRNPGLTNPQNFIVTRYTRNLFSVGFSPIKFKKVLTKEVQTISA